MELLHPVKQLVQDSPCCLQLATSTNESVLACSTSRQLVRIYDTSTGEQMCVFGHPERVNDIEFSPTAPNVLFSTSKNLVHVWDLRVSSKTQWTFNAGRGMASSVSSSGEIIAAGYQRGEIFLWDARNPNQAVRQFESYHSADAVISLEFSRKYPTQLLSAAEDGLVCLFDASKDEDEEFGVYPIGSAVDRAGFICNGEQSIYVFTHTCKIQLWDRDDADAAEPIVEGNDLRQVLSQNGAQIPVQYYVDMFHVDDNVYLAGGNTSGSGIVFCLRDGNFVPRYCFNGPHQDRIRDVCWLKNSNRLVSCCEGGKVIFWSHETQNVTNTNKMTSKKHTRIKDYSVPY